MKLRCLRNHFLFSFVQNQNAKGAFEEETSWGFKITPGKDFQGQDNEAFNKAIQNGRWAMVLITGPECEEVVKGDFVCLEPAMWTSAVDFDGLKVRRSDESKVMLISKEKPNVFVS